MDSPLRPLAPIPRLSGQKNFFSRLKIAGNGFWQFFFLHNFWTKRAIILGKYFKKPVKDCEFSDRQLIHNKLILIFGYVVLNKIYLIFQRLQI